MLKQIPPLRCGMTNQRTKTNKGKDKQKDIRLDRPAKRRQKLSKRLSRRWFHSLFVLAPSPLGGYLQVKRFDAITCKFDGLQIRHCKRVTGKFVIPKYLHLNTSLQGSYCRAISPKKEKPRRLTGAFLFTISILTGAGN